MEYPFLPDFFLRDVLSSSSSFSAFLLYHTTATTQRAVRITRPRMIRTILVVDFPSPDGPSVGFSGSIGVGSTLVSHSLLMHFSELPGSVTALCARPILSFSESNIPTNEV